MPSDLVFKTMNTVHRGLLKVTGGRAGLTFSNMPVVELTTTGRKSGQKRSVMLTSPLQEGGAIVVVASAGGNDRHPAWFLNVRDNPEVEVAFKGGPKERRHARVADSDERARMWQEITTGYKHYAGYQTKTDREIPLVLLEPVSAV
jgi:deazaflavin-dependent oxidoreductase (nitroreductase family)